MYFVRVGKFIVAVALCEVAGLLGSFFVKPALSGWYALLEKPSFAPPDWLFAPVWIGLYFLMGVALYLVWERRDRNDQVDAAMVIFMVHLVLNILWSFIFFGFQNPFYAFVEIIILWAMIIFTMYKFAEINHATLFLLAPYFLWVTFAAFLNFSLWQLNY